MDNQEVTQAKHLLIKAFEAFEQGNLNVAQNLAEIALSLDNNDIDIILFYFSMPVQIGNRSLHDLQNNQVKANEHLQSIRSRRQTGDLSLNEIQNKKFIETSRNYMALLEYINERKYSY